MGVALTGSVIPTLVGSACVSTQPAHSTKQNRRRISITTLSTAQQLSNDTTKTRMKLPSVAPVSIGDQSYTLVDLVTHVTTKDSRYNATADDARQGKRTREAVAAGSDILPADLKKLADVLNRPTCGWGDFKVIQKVPRADGSTFDVTRRAQFPTHMFLPLIDVVQTAAASVS